MFVRWHDSGVDQRLLHPTIETHYVLELILKLGAVGLGLLQRVGMGSRDEFDGLAVLAQADWGRG